MGCDIHGVIQIKPVREGAHWETISIDGNKNLSGHWELPRDYTAFSVLAGVRWYEDEPMPEPKGLPVDFDRALADMDDHSHSWVDIGELKTAVKRYDEILRVEDGERRGELGHKTFLHAILLRMEILNWSAYCDGRVRFVFWFDS